MENLKLPEESKTSFITRNIGRIRKGIGKGLREAGKKVQSFFQITENDIVCYEKTQEHTFLVPCDATVTKSIAYVVRLDIQKSDEISLHLSLKNCMLEDIHLFERFV